MRSAHLRPIVLAVADEHAAGDPHDLASSSRTNWCVGSSSVGHRRLATPGDVRRRGLLHELARDEVVARVHRAGPALEGW